MVMGKMNHWNICIGHYALLSAERSSMQIFHWFSFPVTTSSLVQFQYFKCDNVSMPKTFMHAHSCMLTSLHLKVHNG